MMVGRSMDLRSVIRIAVVFGGGSSRNFNNAFREASGILSAASRITVL